MQRLSELIRKMGNNAKWLTITEPGWSIPMPWVFYYQPIYMKAFGVTGFELGLLLTFSQALSIFSPLLGELFIARLGMKWTFLLIDTVTNAGYLLPLILAKSQADFVAVYVFSALFAAVGPVWETLLAEGTAPRSQSHRLLHSVHAPASKRLNDSACWLTVNAARYHRGIQNASHYCPSCVLS